MHEPRLDFDRGEHYNLVRADPEFDTFYQANGRITRLGQEHKQVIAMLGGTQVERRIYSILGKNEKVQQHFLDIIKSETTRQMAAE